MEDYSSFFEIGISQEKRELSEQFYYYLLSHNGEIGDIIDGLICETDGFKRISGVISHLDIRQLKGNDIAWFSSLKILNSLNRVVFDIGTGVLSDFEILSNMDKVYVPVLRGIAESAKLQHFRQLIKVNGQEAIDDKIKYIEVPDKCYDSDEISRLIEREGM